MSVKEKSIKTVYNFLNDSNLVIPKYQRPYKWTKEHVKQLFDDIQAFKNKSAYRLGTIVLHQNEGEKEKNIVDGEKKNIVDGQQRIVTLLMIIHELRKKEDIDEELEEKLKKLKIIDPSFPSNISRKNIYDNYQVIKKRVENFNTEHIEFLLNKCEFATFTLNDISEAFQFFDSQNARGKPLEPYDLLKAYHINKSDEKEEKRIGTLIKGWEDTIDKDKELTDEEKIMERLFGSLYCIRQWANGQSARYFIKENIGLFKGISEKSLWEELYTKQQELFARELDLHAKQRKIDLDKQKIDIHVLPFRITQRIIDGRRFFEMIAHYQKMVEKYVSKDCRECFKEDNLSDHAPEILNVINTYEGLRKGRLSDKRVRMIFDCLLLYYIDTFEHKEISAAIEQIFIWAYSLLVKKRGFREAGMNNHILNNEGLGHNPFEIIKKASQASDSTNHKPNNFDNKKGNYLKGIEEIRRLLDEVKRRFQ